MIKDLAILSGFISSVFILLYTLMYLLRDIYYISNNLKLKKIVNKILPVLTKYNSFFILMILLFATLHVLALYSIHGFFINSGYVIIFVLIFIIKFNFFSSKNIIPNSTINICAYLLFISLIVHLVFKV